MIVCAAIVSFLVIISLLTETRSLEEQGQKTGPPKQVCRKMKKRCAGDWHGMEEIMERLEEEAEGYGFRVGEDLEGRLKE